MQYVKINQLHVLQQFFILAIYLISAYFHVQVSLNTCRYKTHPLSHVDGSKLNLHFATHCHYPLSQDSKHNLKLWLFRINICPHIRPTLRETRMNPTFCDTRTYFCEASGTTDCLFSWFFFFTLKMPPGCHDLIFNLI